MNIFKPPHVFDLTRKLASQILNKLKDGTTPPGAIEYLWVDRGGWATRMSLQLDRVSRDDLTDLRIAMGELGSGKTHALATTAAIALSKGWAVAQLRFEETDGLDPLSLFYLVARRIVTIERVQSGAVENADFATIQNGLDWLFQYHAKQMLARHKDDVLPAQGADRELTEWAEQGSLDITAERALLAFFRACWDGAHDLKKSIASWWLRGDAMRRPVALAEPTDGRGLLASLVRILRRMGHQGLLITIDEVEEAVKLPSRKRTATWENLRAQIDHSGAPGMLVMVALTKAALESDKGPVENPALMSRLQTAKRSGLDPEKAFDPTATILALDKLDFTRNDLSSVGRQVRRLFAESEGREATHLTDEDIETLIDHVTETLGQMKREHCRVLVQVVVQMLNERKEAPDSSLAGAHDHIVAAVRATRK